MIRLCIIVLLVVAAACVPTAEPVPAPGPISVPAQQVAENSCRWAHDGQCDHPGIGTGVCKPATDVADCGSENDWPRRGRYDREFFGYDDRVAIRPDALPWSAIGKLTFRHGYCTAALVSPRVVLTAAHCLFTDNGTIDAPDKFYAGFDQGRYVARSDVVSYWLPNNYDFRRFSDTSEIDGLDYAFLLLAEPIGRQAGYLDVERLSTADLANAAERRWRVVQAGYSGDREGQLTAHIGCEVKIVYDDNTVAHECDTLQGASGSPIFIETGGAYRILAIESAVYDTKRPLNIAVDSRAFAGDLGRFIDTYDPR